MTARAQRVGRLERAAAAQAHPADDPPRVVFVVAAGPGDVPGRWVRADGAVVEVVYDPAGPEPEIDFPGRPLVISGMGDPFAEASGRPGLRFIPDATRPGRVRAEVGCRSAGDHGRLAPGPRPT
jgi:hypothetical protein